MTNQSIQSNETRNPWIHTYNGHEVDLIEPKPADIDEIDIAHALSLINRFTGHSTIAYSVAQHSVVGSIMAEVCYPQVKWLPQEFLLHDAVEAYVGDISSPLKSMLPGYRVIEERHKVALEKKFAVSLGGAYVKTVDLRMLATERDLLMPAGGSSWNLSEVPFTLEEFIIKSKVVHKVPVAIEPFWDWLWGPWTAEEAETNFLERMEKLKL